MTDVDSPLSRRAFMKACAAWSIMSAARSEAASPSITMFLDESGSPGTDKPFIIGALQTSMPWAHQKQIARIREQTHFRQRLRYSSSNRFKLNFARGLISYFFSQRELRFEAYAFEPSVNMKWPRHPRAAEIKRLDVYRKLLTSASKNRRNTYDLHTQLHTVAGEDRFLHRELKQLQGVRSIRIVQERQEDLTQLAGFVMGCIYGQRTVTSDPVKRDLIDSLTSALGARSLWDPALSNRRDFRVVVVR